MTDAGWHPDPHGRADRRYHDGTRWTEHVTDAAGSASVDPEGAGPAPDAPAPVADAAPPGIVIGAPPPRRSPGAGPAGGDRSPGPQDPDTFDPPRAPAPGTEAATDARPALAKAAGPPVAPDATQVIRPDDLRADAQARSTTPSGGGLGADATSVIRPGDLEAEATSVVHPDAVGARPADATQVTRIPADLLAAGATGPIPVDGGAPAAAPAPPRRSALSPGGLVLAVLGLLVGLVSLLALPWAAGGGTEASFLDLRDAVVATGADIPAVARALLMVGGFFALGVGGVVALARAVGARPLRFAAVVVVVLGVGGLSLLGLGAEVEVGRGTDGGRATPEGQEEAVPGEVVVDDDGAAVLDEDGTPVTVPQPTPEDGLAADGGSLGNDRLMMGALLGSAAMGVAGLLSIVGLLMRGRAGHAMAAAGLGVVALWVAAGLGFLAADEQLGDLGNGAYGFVVATIALAVAAALPAPDPEA